MANFLHRLQNNIISVSLQPHNAILLIEPPSLPFSHPPTSTIKVRVGGCIFCDTVTPLMFSATQQYDTS